MLDGLQLEDGESFVFKDDAAVNLMGESCAVNFDLSHFNGHFLAVHFTFICTWPELEQE
jgi:hypothetical protein